MALSAPATAPAKGVGVDVQRLAILRGSERRQHRDQLVADQLVEQRQVDLFRIADETEIDRFLDIGIRIDHGAGRLRRLHHVAVLAAEADGLAAGFVDVADQLFIDRSGQHHLDDLDGGGIGDAQAGGEFGLDAEPLQHGRDLRTAAMDHHRIDRGLLKQHDIARECLGEVFRAHGVAAIFDDDGFFVVLLHMRECFGQNAGLIERTDGWRVGHKGGLAVGKIGGFYPIGRPAQSAA